MSTTTTRPAAVGVFHDRGRAQEAIRELKRQGFTDDQIGVAAKHDEDLPKGVHAEEEASHAGTGAGAGVAAGLGLGGLWGLGIAAGMLPAIGPVIAGGVLASILASAATGAAAGGLIGALLGLGVSNEDAEYYEQEFESGAIIVTVRANGRFDEARSVLQQFGGYDIRSQRAENDDAGEQFGRTFGETRGSATPGRSTDVTGQRGPTDKSSETIHRTGTHGPGMASSDEGEVEKGRMELREERLRAYPESREVGEVEISKEVTTERETLEVPVKREEIVIRQHPASEQRASDRPIGEGEEIRVPVREERARVQKETVSRGDVSVEKRTVQDTEHVSEEVKKERVKVDKRGDVNVQNRDR